MKKGNRWFRLSLVLVVALFFNIGIANLAMAEKESPLKIGIVDISKIMKDSKAAKNARVIFNKDLDAKKAALKEKNDKVAALDKELKKLDQKSSAWKDKRDKLAQEFKEMKNMEKETSVELNKKDIELTKKIIADVQQILNKLVKSENYSLILDKKAVLAGQEGFDVTDKVIKIYDAQKK
jgi:outer membrane protein